MKLDCRVCLLLLVTAAVIVNARKGKKKDRKSAPQWKSSSMPKLNKRFESVHEGKSLKLDCKAQGHPKPSVTWFKDGVKVMDSEKMEVKKWVLNLNDVTTDMSGNYTCKVENKHGQLEWTFHLDVQVKVWPLVVDGPHNITQMVGSNVAFRCRVLNDPQATIRWQRIVSGENRDPNAPPRDFLANGDDPEILTLENIKKEDEGEYRCMAGNVWGLKYSSAWLSVIEPAIQVPPLSEMDNRREPEIPRGFDPYDPNSPSEIDEDDSYYNGGYNPGNLDPYGLDFGGPDLYYTTTRRPKNRNNRRKNGKKKDRKKDKQNKQDRYDIMEEYTTTTPTTTSTTTTTVAAMEDGFRTTFPEIWNFDDKDDFDGISDSRYNPPKRTKDKDEPAENGNTGSAKSADNKTVQGSISSWTIYTIVGAVGGVILLVGLVAITFTLCCKKEEGGVYKSTPV